VALLIGLAGVVVLIFVARWTGRSKIEDKTERPGDPPGQKL
jgi:hypothetical protein